MFRTLIIYFCLRTTSSIALDSPIGSTLLRNARALEEDESAYSWMVDYSLKFTSCHTVTEYSIDNDGAGYLYKEKLVEFKICPTGQCDSTCEGGNYVAPLEDYATAYAEQMVIDKAYACAQVKANCVCEEEEEDEGDEEEEEDEEDCEDVCYLNAGLGYCIEDDGDEEGDDGNYEVDLADYIPCKEYDPNDDGNGQYYIGLKCAKDGKGVNVGIFTENSCSVEKANDAYFPYTEFLPYQNETLISSDCIDCAQVQGEDENEEDDGDDDADVIEVSEMCLVNYFESAKCEENMDIDDPNIDGCELINKLYLREDDYEPEDSTFMKFSLHILVLLSMAFFVIIFRLCYIAQNQQRKMREDELKWRNQLY